jgi:transcriptional regulator with XRE-family HTH domain
MDNRAEVRQFLVTRRAKITPEQAGVPLYSGKRRVPGLRREEVALLAGVSVDYYTRVEKGNLGGVSDSVLEAIACALQLDEAERAHLSDLAPPTPRRLVCRAARRSPRSGRASAASSTRWP